MFRVCLILILALSALPVRAQADACDLDNLSSMLAVMQEALADGDPQIIIETLADLENVVRETYDGCTSIVISGAAGGMFRDIEIPPGYYTVLKDGGGAAFTLTWEILEGTCEPSAQSMTFVGVKTFGVHSDGCTARIGYFASRKWTVTLQAQHD
jgi:hypothetical protein